MLTTLLGTVLILGTLAGLLYAARLYRDEIRRNREMRARRYAREERWLRVQ